MKINWITGAFIFFGCFVAFILTMVFMSAREDFDLVHENYYEQEIGYDSLMIRKRTFNDLNEPLQVLVGNEQVLLTFPAFFSDKDITGEVKMYNKVAKEDDRNYSLSLSKETQFVISRKELNKGRYELQADWVSDGTGYHTDVNVNIP